METKTCSRCKVEYPKTAEYFFEKIYKQKLSNGNIATYKSLRYVCKKCNGLNMMDRKRKNICAKNGWKIEDYDKNWREQKAFDRLKYKELHGIKKSTRASIIRKINQGYVFKDMETYKKDCEENINKGHLSRRKYEYGHNNKLTMKERNKAQRDVLHDSLICNKMKKKLGEVPQEIIQTQRLIIKLNRELNK